MDSGAGGLSVLYEVLQTCSIGGAVYFGDNLNAPYGNRSQRDLIKLASSGVDKLRAENVDAIVFACGTLSTCVLADIKKLYPEIRFYGTFPPLESYEMRGEDYVVIATSKTAESMKKSVPNARVFAAENLASDIERNLFALNRVRLEKHLKGLFPEPKTVILGCTHYALIAKTFRAYFPHSKIVFGAENTARKISADFLCIYNNVFQENPTGKCPVMVEKNQKTEGSDHFWVKKYGVLTTFVPKGAKADSISFKNNRLRHFNEKKVKFIGSEWRTNLCAFANICSNLTE